MERWSGMNSSFFAPKMHRKKVNLPNRAPAGFSDRLFLEWVNDSLKVTPALLSTNLIMTLTLSVVEASSCKLSPQRVGRARRWSPCRARPRWNPSQDMNIVSLKISPFAARCAPETRRCTCIAAFMDNFWSDPWVYHGFLLACCLHFQITLWLERVSKRLPKGYSLYKRLVGCCCLQPDGHYSYISCMLCYPKVMLFFIWKVYHIQAGLRLPGGATPQLWKAWIFLSVHLLASSSKVPHRCSPQVQFQSGCQTRLTQDWCSVVLFSHI